MMKSLFPFRLPSLGLVAAVVVVSLACIGALFGYVYGVNPVLAVGVIVASMGVNVLYDRRKGLPVPWGLIGLIVLSCAFGVLLSGAASAQDTSPSIGAGGVGGALVGALLPTLIGLLGSASVWAVAQGARYLGGKTALVKNERLHSALDLVSALVWRKVRELSQQSVTLLKAASADGTLSTAEASAALLTASKEVWASLPADLRALFVAVAGSEAGAIKTYVTPAVEDAVATGKTMPTVLPPPSVTSDAVAAARARIGLDLKSQYAGR